KSSGANLESYVFERVTPISGDICDVNLGIKDSILIEEMWNEIDIVLNSAATTNIDERHSFLLLMVDSLEVANLLLEICEKAIATSRNCIAHGAYVCGEKGGYILESPIYMGDTLKGTSRLDSNVGKELVEEYLDKLRVQGATNEEITSTMKDFGTKSAKLYGWPNTYVYTKALGEMLLGHFNKNLPLVIIRATMITSTYKEPFSGWIEGVSFDDSNTEKLRVTIRENDVDMHLFNFDTKCIDWEDYIMNTHIPGLIKYSMKR
ncbi:hypothetical protein SO802_019151, partial [Lithocarpus litseifolius]